MFTPSPSGMRRGGGKSAPAAVNVKPAVKNAVRSAICDRWLCFMRFLGVTMGFGRPGGETHECADGGDRQQADKGSVPAMIFHQRSETPSRDQRARITK